MIWFTGDINYCDGYFDTGIGVASTIRKGVAPLEALPHRSEDIWVGNFEGVCSDSSELIGIAAQQFRVEPEALRSLWHPDIYAVANNHVMQHGANAYRETLKNITSFGAKYVGSDNQRTIIIPHQGKSVAITAFNQRPENFSFGTLYWADPEYQAIQEEFATHVQTADYKVAYIHWGNEFMNYPYIDQRRFAHWLVDLGYDMIIGMHPHILQGYEIYKDKHIFYSLGNTVFNMAWYKTAYGALVLVDLTGDRPIVDYRYIHIDKQFTPHIVEAEEVPDDCRFEYLNTLIAHNEENEKYYRTLFQNMKAYRRANYKKILKDIFHMKPQTIATMACDFIKRHI